MQVFEYNFQIFYHWVDKKSNLFIIFFPLTEQGSNSLPSHPGLPSNSNNFFLLYLSSELPIFINKTWPVFGT